MANNRKKGHLRLLNSFGISLLFSRIYAQMKVPEQWLVSKTIPVFKNKGDPKDIENYRPISNLCSCSKISEKLILKRMTHYHYLPSTELLVDLPVFL